MTEGTVKTKRLVITIKTSIDIDIDQGLPSDPVVTFEEVADDIVATASKDIKGLIGTLFYRGVEVKENGPLDGFEVTGQLVEVEG